METKNIKSRPLKFNLSFTLGYLLLAEGDGVVFTSDLPTKVCMHFSPPPFIQYCPSILPPLTWTKLYLIITTNNEAPLYAIFSSLPPIPHSQPPIYPSAPNSHTPTNPTLSAPNIPLNTQSHTLIPQYNPQHPILTLPHHTQFHTYTQNNSYITLLYILMFMFFIGTQNVPNCMELGWPIH